MDGLQVALADHGLWVLFVLAVIEGPLVVLAATALAQMGAVDPRWVWSVAVAADLTGDVLLYSIGRFVPGLLPPRYRPRPAQESTAALFRRCGVRLLLLAKLTHFAGLPTLVSAGFGRMAFLPFLVWSLAGTMVKVSAIVLIGWHFWQAIGAGDMTDAVTILLGLGLCGALAVLLVRRRRWI